MRDNDCRGLLRNLYGMLRGVLQVAWRVFKSPAPRRRWRPLLRGCCCSTTPPSDTTAKPTHLRFRRFTPFAMSTTAVLGLTALPVRTVRRTVSAKVCTIAPAPAGADPRLRCSRLVDRLAQRRSRCFVAGRTVRRGAGRLLAEPALARPDFAPRSLARFRRLSSPLLPAAWPYARPPSWSRWWPRPPRPSLPSPPSPPARPPLQRRRVHPRTPPIARARSRQAQ